MKVLKFIWLSLAMIFIFNSCQKIVMVNIQSSVPYSTVVPQNQDGEFGIVFGSYSSATRAMVESASNTGYDEFKLYTWNSVGDTIMNPYLVHSTEPYIYKYDDVNGQELQYFKKVANSYEFIGIIPTDRQMSVKDGVVVVSNVLAQVVNDNRVLGNLTEDSPNEFLYAYKKVEKSSYGSTVTLPFNHGNAIIYLGFTSDRNDTELLDYVPGVPAGPDIVTQSMQFSPFPAYGPSVATSSITSADVEYINSKYSCSAGWIGYYSSSATITGDLDSNMWDYLLDKHPSLANENIQNWASYVSNSNMRIVHLAVEGNNYRAWFVNVVNANITTITIPGTPAVPGIEGIRVFSASMNNNSYVHESHANSASAVISSEGLSWKDIVNSDDVITFSLPVSSVLSENVTWSPSTFYAIPANAGITNLVIKLSYKYNGINSYDVRVPIQLPSSGLVEGKYYKYTIHITSTGNGGNDPDTADDNKDDIDIVSNPVITVNASFSDYTIGDEQTIII